MTFADAKSGQRMTGVRVDYASAPEPVQRWAEQTLGAPVVHVQPRVGGMSPAIAASLRAANGATAFVKAVGGSINPDTPTHFRHEISVLEALPPAPYRAGLLASYDDGDWVAILLADVDGRHPDWTSASDRDAVFAAVRQQTAELTPVPDGLPDASIRSGLVKYLESMVDPTPTELAGLPTWAARDLPELRDMIGRTIEHHRDESFCHWDLRHDNILIRRADGQPLLLDWGMSRRGQHWSDALVFALEWVDSAEFDRIVSSIGPTPEEEDDVTGVLAGIGCYLAMVSTHPAPQALPNLPAFRRRLGLACLEGVRRRTDR